MRSPSRLPSVATLAVPPQLGRHMFSSGRSVAVEELLCNPPLIDRWLQFLKDNDDVTARLINTIEENKIAGCVTESPRRPRSTSPKRKASPTRLPDISSTISQFVDAIDYTQYGSSLIDDVPERDWRLLATLARKRDQEMEREKMAVELRRMWEKEKAERDTVTAETMNQYKRYIERKRDQEKLLLDFRNLQRETEDQLKTELLMDSIRHKEKRSAKQLNLAQDMKAQELVEKALEQEAREMLAAERRTRKIAAEEWKRRTELEDCFRRLEDAQRKRDANIRNTSKRVAINNALSSWESTILKQEAQVVEEFKRAQHAAHAELTTLRSMRIARSRALREKRARYVADFTQQLREAVRMSRS